MNEDDLSLSGPEFRALIEITQILRGLSDKESRDRVLRQVEKTLRDV